MKALAFALLLFSPALARADVIFKCESVKYELQLSASLRFTEDGRGGRFEMDYWNGYPPMGLVYADLRAPKEENGRLVFPSEMDNHSRYSAMLRVPRDFLKADAILVDVAMKTWTKVENSQLKCTRF